jgi:hypothetical protein
MVDDDLTVSVSSEMLAQGLCQTWLARYELGHTVWERAQVFRNHIKRWWNTEYCPQRLNPGKDDFCNKFPSYLVWEWTNHDLINYFIFYKTYILFCSNILNVIENHLPFGSWKYKFYFQLTCCRVFFINWLAIETIS